MKRTITEHFETIYWSDWNGETFWSFRAFINNLNIPDEATIDHDWESTGISIELRREETDEEYEKRLKEAAEKRAREEKYNEENERLVYERLKAKFEK